MDWEHVTCSSRIGKVSIEASYCLRDCSSTYRLETPALLLSVPPKSIFSLDGKVVLNGKKNSLAHYKMVSRTWFMLCSGNGWDSTDELGVPAIKRIIDELHFKQSPLVSGLIWHSLVSTSDFARNPSPNSDGLKLIMHSVWQCCLKGLFQGNRSFGQLDLKRRQQRVSLETEMMPWTHKSNYSRHNPSIPLESVATSKGNTCPAIVLFF